MNYIDLKLAVIFIFLIFHLHGLESKDLNANKSPNYKYDVASLVFKKLVEAKGVKNMVKPSFVLTQSMRNVAWSKYEKAEIGLEEKAYDICASFGKDSLNALAVILSHEVTHYYEKHGWTESFIAEENIANRSGNFEMHEDHATLELQADYLGGFLAYAAGYNPLDIMPQFLRKVYKEYNLPSAIEGYPDLAVRIKSAENALIKTNRLIDVFECSNSLVFIEQYDQAIILYKYILNHYQSREIYNNLGIVHLSAFMKISSPKELSYAFPFELDAETRIASSKRGGHEDFELMNMKKEQLLQNAIEYFKQAIILDDSYTLAKFNLANAYVLKNEIDDAEYFLLKSKKSLLANQDNGFEAKLLVLQGIIYAIKNDKESAKNNFLKAIELNSIIGSLNLSILKNNGPAKKETLITSFNRIKSEIIEDTSLDKCVNNLVRGRLEPNYIIEVDKQNSFGVLELINSKIYINLSSFNDEYTLIHQTSNNYSGLTSKKIKLGDNYKRVVELYSTPTAEFSFANSSKMAYQDDQIIFDVHPLKGVRNWSVFRIGKN